MTVNGNGVVEDYSEEVLDCHDKELADLRDYYNLSATLFDKIKERTRNWDKFLQFEVCL